MGAACGMRSRKGFTLIEVILALLLFTTMATAIGLAFRNVLWAHTLSRETANFREEIHYARQAVQLLSDREDVEAGGKLQLDVNREGVWYAEVEDTAVPDLFEVTLTVEVAAASPEEEGLQDSETFYLLRPSWSEGISNSSLKTDFEEKLRQYREDQQWGWQYP